MKSISQILSERYFKIYSGFYIRCLNSKAGYTYHGIYDSSFRLIYQGNFKSRFEACKFIDRNQQLLKKLSNGNLIIHDKYNFEYFTGGYNYYGELIDKSGS